MTTIDPPPPPTTRPFAGMCRLTEIYVGGHACISNFWLWLNQRAHNSICHAAPLSHITRLTDGPRLWSNQSGATGTDANAGKVDR